MSIGFHTEDYYTEDDSCIGGMHGEFREHEYNMFDLAPISGIHGDSDDTEDDSCIGGMHGEFREKE